MDCQMARDIFQCEKEFGYPSNFPNFHWWKSPDKRKVATIVRDEIPVPELPNRYPYRYSSAGPCSVGRTQKEWDMYRCFLDSKPRTKRRERFDVMDIVQIEGYETTTMTESLRPFRSKRHPTEFRSTKIPTGLNEPLFVPFKGHSEFDQYVIDTLYPGWKQDPLYR
ncbi:unnamed protein product, partial [Candidula unifasciata]